MKNQTKTAVYKMFCWKGIIPISDKHRSSTPEVLFRKNILKIYCKFTEQPRNKLQHVEVWFQ